MDTLVVRMTREPRSYAWSNFLVTERAAVGVWSPKLGVIRDENGKVTRDVRALVLDYGCTPDEIEDLVALLDQWCATLSRDGVSELTVFTSAPSRAAVALIRLAKRREPYVVRCRILPRPMSQIAASAWTRCISEPGGQRTAFTLLRRC